MKFLLLLLLPILSHADTTFQLTEDELNPESEEVLLKKPEKYLRNESMIYDFDSNLGIKDQRRFTGTDRNRFSVAGHISGDYEHFNDILGIEATYMHRSTRYDQIWWGAQFFQHSTYFDALTQNHTSGTDANSESRFVRPGDQKNNVMGIGAGVGYRFRLLLDIFKPEDWFENVDVFANVIRLEEKFIGKTYQGYGLTTNYGIHKRSDTSYFYGGKLSYNLASVTREQIGTESKGERSFALGWLSLAFELGFFF